MLKLIFAGLAVILLLSAALVILDSQTPENETGVTVFVDKEPEQISEISVENGFGGFRVSYDEAEGGYVFDDIPANVVDVDGFLELMNHASGFGSLRTVEEKAKDLSAYGLDEPKAVVKVDFSDGEKYAMAIGNKEPVSGNYYGMVFSEDEIGRYFSENDPAAVSKSINDTSTTSDTSTPSAPSDVSTPSATSDTSDTSYTSNTPAAPAETSSAKYVSDNTPKTIYIFAQEDLIYFLIRKESYISFQVTPELAVSSPLSAIRDITFSGTALESPITITAVTKSDQQTYLAAKSFGPATHIVRMKGVYELDQTYGIEILGSVLGIRAFDVAAYNVTQEELSAFGFDDPYMQVDFSLKNGTDYIADYQLRLIPHDEYYLAYMLGSGVVFMIEPPSFISIDCTNLCLRWFLSPLRSDLDSLTVEFDDEVYEYTTQTDDDGNIIARVNGEVMDTELFFSFYRLITGASSDGMYLTDPVNEGDPEMTITYVYNIEGKEPDVMRLYKGGLRRLNVDINGVTEFDMREAFEQAVKTACRHTLTGETIEENW